MALNRKVTMKDIAIKANVTTQTVSRALNDSPNVLPETKKKVLDIAKELNYIKNNNASILRSGQSKIIAVFYDNLRNLYFSITSDLIEAELRKCGYTIMTIPVFRGTINFEIYNYALSLGVAGIITFLDVDKEVAESLKKNPFPIILYGRKSSYKNIGYICIDDKKGGYLAGKELLSFNGKSFLYVSETLDLECAKDRYLGFKDAVKNINIEIIDVTKESVEKRLDSLINSGHNPDSIFCFNDMLAFRVIRYYEKNHLKRPIIVGFDALSKQIVLPCELTSIGVDENKMAELGVSCLIDLIENKMDKNINIVMPVQIFR